MQKVFRPAASGDTTVFVFAETMLARLANQAGAGDPHNKISIAIISINGEEHFFPYTHTATLSLDQTDEKSIKTALGNSAEYWMDSRLKLLRVPTNQVRYAGNNPPKNWNKRPSMEPKFYNYSSENPLRTNPSRIIPTMEKPKAVTA